KDFGLVRLHVTYYQQPPPLPAPPYGVTGQALVVHCAAFGFKRDDKTKQPNIAVTIRVLDEKGNPTTKNPFNVVVNDKVPESYLAVPMQLPLELNRAGRFTVEFQATDQLTKKTAKLSFPITVVDISTLK